MNFYTVKIVRKQLKLQFWEFGVANISIIPVRSEPSEKSEMLTQILFGEHFEILKSNDKWARVRLVFDGYEGWVDKKMILPIPEKLFRKITEHGYFSVNTVTHQIYDVLENPMMTIVAGSSLPLFNGKRTFKLVGTRYKLKTKFHFLQKEAIRDNIKKTAMLYVNAPYLWGGRSPFGIDCSGFAQIVYKINGAKIPRDANQQVNMGVAVNFVNEAKPGDLAFFDNDEGQIVHTGILLGNSKIIHSSGKVRIDKIDHNGIFSFEQKKYTHKLRVVKDILSYI